MNQTISDIASVDATGQTFRYPFGNESQKHLVDIGGVISCRVLWIKFRELENNLDTLHRLSNFLLREFNLGSFTSKLSRVQLFSLAKDLPNGYEWKSPNFKDTKLQLRKKYDLSSNDLTKAINTIRTNHEMAHYISLDLKLLGLTQEQLHVLIEQWINCNPDYTDNTSKVFDSEILGLHVLESIGDQVTRQAKAYEVVAESISAEYLAGINALFYFSKDLQFCEYYVSTYEQTLKETSSIIDNKKDIRQNFMHVFRKRNFIQNILMSLYFLHFYDLADSMVSKYNLTDIYRFIPHARSRELFALPSIGGY